MSSTRLGAGDFGEDVARIQKALTSHGIEVSLEELKRMFFGPTTRDAVRKFQIAQGLNPTGEICEVTAARLAAELKPTPQPHSEVLSSSVSVERASSLELGAGGKDIAETSYVKANEEGATEVDALSGSYSIKRVMFPLHVGAQGESVADLQRALQFLLDRAVIRIDHPLRSEVEKRLRVECECLVFGEQTRSLVMAVQENLQLSQTGAVDERTATMLNAELFRIGSLKGESSPPKDSSTTKILLTEKLLPLLRTSAVLRESTKLEQFVGLLAERDNLSLKDWPTLAVDAGFSAQEVDEVKLTLELATLTQHDVPMVAALQELRSDGRIRSARDLINWSEDEWEPLVRHCPAADREVRQAAIKTRLHETFAMAYVAQALAIPPAVDLTLVRRVVASNPSLDITAPAQDMLDFEGFSDDERQSAISSLAALQREVNAFPDLDPKILLQTEGDITPRVLNPIRADVARFLAQAQDFHLRTTRLGPYVADHPAATEGLSNVSLAIAQVQRMQRVFRVAPSLEAMHELMGEGIHSAFRITRMPADVFVARFDGRLGLAISAQAVYAAARMVSAATAAVTWAVRLRSAGPLPAAVGAWPPPRLAIEDAELRELLQSGRRTNHS